MLRLDFIRSVRTRLTKKIRFFGRAKINGITTNLRQKYVMGRVNNVKSSDFFGRTRIN